MSRPSKVLKENAGNLSSVHHDETASEVLDFVAAGAVMECRSALVKGHAAARAAFAKHRASVDPILAQALETVGTYTTKEVTSIFTSPF